MHLAGVIGAALTAAVFAALLRRTNSEYAVVLRTAAGVLIVLEILQAVLPALREISGLLSSAGVGGEYSGILLRALGVVFLTQFAADACRDAEETALASKVELAGRVGILVLALPLFARVASIASALVKK
ncbi:stage III sporulation protein AD [Ruminococcaceae bacterium CPB6]|uniref:Stage III sporulation protein AD n=1 Tax=Caproicibacterium lactatifermentans TaxID=2666138 RepID=A0A859DTF8_9FIRM|nr:stage III sporulation protein AD [Ruminococcaceae bacterium CPB6]QKN24799.1 stage III sporulation protein AD [Caproicibacterium lactatifermentans]QKO31218.1 stage III sporulation protein AD [Caproicibacterium lactatifermentans]